MRKKLTATTTASGAATNSSSTSASGASCRYDWVRASMVGASDRNVEGPATTPRVRGARENRKISRASRGLELVPALDHVLVLVHHRVPAGDVREALRQRAAVAYRAGPRDRLAVVAL